ncbi:MAG: 16S rRNA (cytidine(1402)-2'-O)-methyltransferase [bacterium]|nr:16S rRNA (cytidine(1402)-2'-O)-methyltransferase [bacterium]
MGTLYIIGTPIGNLADITFRAVETLKTVDLILAEDTRVTKRLLEEYAIAKPVIRFDEYAAEPAYDAVLNTLRRGASVAVVTDAGTPGIADPGWKLTRFVRNKLPETPIVSVPGPSSVTAALSLSGIPAGSFTFLGYPPQKKGRATFFRDITTMTVRPIVLFESPHRIGKTLAELGNAIGEEREVFVGRELTKMHEEAWTGTLLAAKEHFTGPRGRGEFVLVLP